jgi:hypothetical protein
MFAAEGSFDKGATATAAALEDATAATATAGFCAVFGVGRAVAVVGVGDYGAAAATAAAEAAAAAATTSMLC